MGDSGGGDEMAMVEEVTCDGDSVRERVFSVGEVVEFWEGRSYVSPRRACFC
jgi:hypothetical protein